MFRLLSYGCDTVWFKSLLIFLVILYFSFYKLRKMDMFWGGHSPVSMQQSLCPSVRKFHLRNYPNNLDEIGGW